MSVISDDLLQELMQSFHDEAIEHIETINKALLTLERQDDPKTSRSEIQNAFRAAHSLKGAARAVNVSTVEELAHGMESVLQLARQNDLELDPATCDILYDVLDTIQKALDGQTIDISALTARTAAVAAGNDSHQEVTVEVPKDLTAKKDSAPHLDIEEPFPNHNHTSDDKFGQNGNGTAATNLSNEGTIRVAVEKLDELNAQVGELLVSRINSEQRLLDARSVQNQLVAWAKTWREMNALFSNKKIGLPPQIEEIATRHESYLKDLTQTMNELVQSFSRDATRLSMVTGDLQDKVRRMRMVPFQTIALVLERVVRDAAHSEKKSVDFIIEGYEVELDKKILESLKDPLLHLLRNAVSHGIEQPELRKQRSKPLKGQIKLGIQQRGSEVHIKVSDDGGGFDISALQQAARDNGKVVSEDNGNSEDTLQLAFLPGITTAKHITAISGRGVGLDVVHQELEAIQGRIEVENSPGNGATINLIVPTSLSMTRELLVQIGSEYYGIPLQTVEKIIEPENRITIGGRMMVNLEGVTIPLVPLASILERPVARTHDDAKNFAIVIGIADQRMALVVDNVLTEQELAVKSLDWPLRRVRNVSGVALLGDGSPVMILNPTDIIRSANHVQMVTGVITESHKDTQQINTHILVVDDSITTRTLEKNILSAAGFTVTTATNGVEALDRLSEHPIEIIVSDVEMPEMDGIKLTRIVREKTEYASLPVILVTSLESQQDREQGMLAGADAYIVKRGFDQAELLSTIQQLLVGR